MGVVEVMGYRANLREDEMTIEDAASAGIKSMERLVRLLSSSSSKPEEANECREATVGSFNKLISVINRTGHARFRRAPLSQQPQPSITVPKIVTTTLDFTKLLKNGTEFHYHQFNKNKKMKTTEAPSFSVASSSANSSFMSSITGEASVSNENLFGPTSSSSLYVPSSSLGKPPLSSAKKRCHDHHNNHQSSDSKVSRSTCHCSSKRRKTRVKKTVRVAAISSKVADIPADDYSWRKYGQKPIKGSPYPRGYYKCSTVRGCPARKHVEREIDDPTMLVVTYKGDHRHSLHPALMSPSLPNNTPPTTATTTTNTPSWLLSLHQPVSHQFNVVADSNSFVSLGQQSYRF